MNTEIFELGEGIIMRTAKTTDAKALSELVNSNKQFLAKWLDWAKEDFDEEKALNLIQRGAIVRDEGRKYELGIFRGGEYIGHVTLFAIDLEKKVCEIGYWLAEKETGKGLATRACRRMLELASDKLYIRTIKLHTVESNTASNAVAKKLGFKFQSSEFDEVHGEKVNFYTLKF